MALPIANQEVLLVLLILEMSVAVEKAENYIDVMILNNSILVILKEIGNNDHRCGDDDGDHCGDDDDCDGSDGYDDWDDDDNVFYYADNDGEKYI